VRAPRAPEQTPAAAYRVHGRGTPSIVLVHGGPGAAGEMGPVGRRLARDGLASLEPFQRAPSVAGQIRELADTIRAHAQTPADLIGHSWGAWLSYLAAARHPELVRRLVLVGSGPFEERYVKVLVHRRDARLTDAQRRTMRRFERALARSHGSRAARLWRGFGRLVERTDAFAPLPHRDTLVEPRPDLYDAVWPQAARLRRTGRLLAAGRQIRCPVLAIHGAEDPHPPAGVEGPLRTVLADFRMETIPRCGHSPWFERYGRVAFYRALEREVRAE
jgi:pimeloyl-ACP methyl ester carboxylesterase